MSNRGRSKFEFQGALAEHLIGNGGYGFWFLNPDHQAELFNLPINEAVHDGEEQILFRTEVSVDGARLNPAAPRRTSALHEDFFCRIQQRVRVRWRPRSGVSVSIGLLPACQLYIQPC